MIQNQWYVGCASSQLKSELVSSQLLDKPIVLFRDKAGQPQALLDRCCHRGYPLSKGQLKDGHIHCGFHGWQYDTGGNVIRVPSQREDKPIPKSFCVPSFKCTEKDGYIWVWAGDLQPTAPPEQPEIHAGYWLQGTRIIECNYLRALEITFDAPHIYFLHPTHPATIAAAKYGYGESESELRITKNGCIVFGPVTTSENEPIPAQGFAMEFSLPGRIRFSINGAAFMTFYTMPLAANRCRMDWTISNWSPNTTEKILWTGDGGQVIAEDQIALELIQKTYEREGEGFEKSVETDSPTLLLRRIMKAAEAGSWPKDLETKRRIFSSMGATRFS